MKSLLPLLLIPACAPIKPVEKPIWARVTFYHAYEDKYGAKVAASPKIRNKPGVGVAAHPDFPFFTEIRIPALKGKLDSDDKFTVIDRGSAVTKKRASRGGAYVFDVFAPKSQFKQLQRSTPPYTWIYGTQTR